MWVETVVASMSDSKKLGMPFGQAWGLAVARHPPRLSELGVPRAAVDTLLDQSANSTLQWYRDVCEAAYVDAPAADGSPSRLRGLRAALEGGFDEVPLARTGVRVVPKRAQAA